MNRQETLFVDEDPKSRKIWKKGPICCCFQTVGICVLTFVTVLILLGIVLYFLFPSPPKVEVSLPFIPNGSKVVITGGADSLSGFINGVLSQSNFTLSFVTLTNITVESTSYIDIGIRSIDVKIKLKDLQGKLIESWNGNGTVSNLAFPARQKTSFQLPVSNEYKSSFSISGLSDPAITMLTQRCIVDTKKEIDTVVTTRFEISAFSWLGIHPEFTSELPQPCPDVTALLGFKL